MSFFLLLIIHFFICLNASTLSLDPSEETREIYAEEREIVLSIHRAKFGKCLGINREESFPEFEKAWENLFNLSPIELIKAMLKDCSDYFLILFWDSIFQRSFILTFSKVPSLESYDESDPLKLGDIFDSFTQFLRLHFLNVKPSVKIEATNSSSHVNSLRICKLFYYNKLIPIGRKLLSRENLAKERKEVEDMICILEKFLNSNPQDQISTAYTSLRRDIRIGVVIPTLAVKEFSFLSEHLQKQLNCLSYSDFYLLLDWLSLQSPKFLIYFFYFLEYRLDRERYNVHFFGLLFNGNFSFMRYSAEALIANGGEYVYAFGNWMYDPKGVSNMGKLVDKILKKMDRFLALLKSKS